MQISINHGFQKFSTYLYVYQMQQQEQLTIIKPPSVQERSRSKQCWMLSDQMRVHPLCGLPFYCSHFQPKEECVSNLARNQISKCSFQTAIKCQIWFGMRWQAPCWLRNTCAYVFGGGIQQSTLHLETETRAKLSSATTSISQMIAGRPSSSFVLFRGLDLQPSCGLERIKGWACSLLTN